MSTINSVQFAVDDLRRAFDAHVVEDHSVYQRTQDIQALLQERTIAIENIQDHVKNVDERLRRQEIEAKSNQALFNENKQLLEDIKKVVKIVRWIVLAIGATIIADLLNYLWHLIHP